MSFAKANGLDLIGDQTPVPLELTTGEWNALTALAHVALNTGVDQALFHVIEAKAGQPKREAFAIDLFSSLEKVYTAALRANSEGDDSDRNLNLKLGYLRSQIDQADARREAA